MMTSSRNADLTARAIAANDRLGAVLAELISIADAIREGLSMAVEAPVKPPSEAPSIAPQSRDELPRDELARDERLAAHRRAHRPGHPSRIDRDPELQTFIAARIKSQTFDQITDAIRAHFPPARQVGRTSVHRW